ncbi:hypothetical protein BKI52_29830 [marine bacterium AO1-C]|nr:hypothetical protein BKI52_29830 [marine bacterium AO1-C]
MVTTWTGAAKRDLQQIYQRLSANDPTTAKATIEAILAGTDNLHENYQAGKPEGLLSGEKVPYKYITVGYYKILYTFDAEKVSIRSIFHLRQMAEQNQALIAQLDVKAAEVATKAAEEAAKVAASQPTPEPVVEPTPEIVEETSEPPVVNDTVTTPDTDTVTTEVPETPEVADTTTPETPETPTPETPTTETPAASMADLEALRAKMGSGEVSNEGGDVGFDAAALEAELMADDEKEKEDTPEFKDISLDDMDTPDKPAGE